MGFIDFDIYVRGRAREALFKAIEKRGLRTESVKSLKNCWELIVRRISERFMAEYEKWKEMAEGLRKAGLEIGYNRYGHCVAYCDTEAKKVIRDMFGRAWV
jgi:hypothetical protein